MKIGMTIILILFSIFFWYYSPIYNTTVINIVNLVSIGIMTLSYIQVYQNKGLRFKNAVLVLIAGILLNILSAYFNHGQSVMGTFLSYGTTYFILMYFFLHEYEVEIKDVENIIIVFAILYSVFYLIQESAFPRVIFNAQMYIDRGTLRLRLAGSGFLMLGYFLVLNRYMIKHKMLFLILALFFFVILLKSGFRSLTAAAIFLSGVMMIRLVKYSVLNYFLIVLAVVFFIGLLQFDSTSSIIDGMVNATTKDMDEGDDYIRRRSRDYFTKVYPKNLSYYIVGGGLPGDSSYGRYLRYIETEYGFFWSDLGIVGFFFVIGAIATLGLVWYLLKVIFMKLPPDKLYLKMFFAYLILVSFTTMELMRGGMFAVEAIVLYLVDKSLNDKGILFNRTIVDVN